MRNVDSLSPFEQQLWQKYRQMYWIATGLLCVVFFLAVVSSIFVADYPWLRFLQGFAEAATVGALADWFAVTALFRHPLGLPIPHTAILPAKKLQLAESLAAFLSTHFLDPEIVRERLQSFNFLSNAAQLLQHHRSAIVYHGARFLQRSIKHLDPGQWIAQIMHHLRNSFPQWNLSQSIGKFLKFLLEHRFHQTIVDELIHYAIAWTENNRSVLHHFIISRIPWYVPRPFRENLANYFLELFLRFLREVQKENDHPVRQQFEKFLLDFAEQLQSSEEYQKRVRKIIDELLSHHFVADFVQNVLQQLSEKLYNEIGRSPEKVERFLEQLVIYIERMLTLDDPVNTAVNETLRDFVVEYLQEHRSKVRDFIVAVVQRWDEQQFVQKIELHVGRDLQFIRMNGTIVGGFIGLLLTVLLELF